MTKKEYLAYIDREFTKLHIWLNKEYAKMGK